MSSPMHIKREKKIATSKKKLDTLLFFLKIQTKKILFCIGQGCLAIVVSAHTKIYK